MKNFFAVIVLSLMFVYPLHLAGQDSGIEARNKKIDSRAAEIVKQLPKTPHCVGRPITDRDAWNTIAALPTFKDVVKDAEKVAATPIQEVPKSLYMDFYETGNRDRYQRVNRQKYVRLHQLVLGECIENKGRFIVPLEEMIRSICADPSWVWPAHDRNAEIYKGTAMYSDLRSTDTSVELGLAVLWLGNKLSPEIRKLILDNVERRTFAPYEAYVKEDKQSRGMWWVRTSNNWNSVCHAGTVGAALTLLDSPQRRAWYIASAEHFMDDFFRGFTPDGYCSEGMGYWNYGFGNFADLAEMVYQATNGSTDFFTMPKVRNCALFGPRMEVAPNQFAAFADCSITSKPNEVLTGFLSKRLGLGLTEYEKELPKAGALKAVGVYAFPNSAAEIPAAPTAAPILGELRTEFPDAGILICRPKPGDKNQMAFVCKAGHNNEHHNHNDVGSFTVMYNGKMPILDPGGEVYTQRTFSNKRYDSKLLNSFGHPVPIINGQLQKTGRNAEGKVMAKDFSDERDTFNLNLAPAYQLEELKQLERLFMFHRMFPSSPGAPGTVTIVDSVKLEPAGTFETALVTYETWKDEGEDKNSGTRDFSIGDLRVKILTKSKDKTVPLEFSAVEIDEDASARKKPTRLSFKIAQPVTEAEIHITVLPAIQSPAL
ncbi:MAG: heparinase II/III family protein [Planctomycetaceae bacterium]|nr:heparinase II/III family protein [Planctomycetaceae bacterium]